jgi:uncharacterized tellurite resistance protein B-like protein
MLKELTSFFSELAGGTKQAAHFEDGDYRLAAAALIVHVATLDGELSASERDKLHALFCARYDLDDATSEELIDSALEADREAVDFYHFTSVLMRSLDEAGRLRVIEMMWQMALADGGVSEFEDNVLWRVADLLGVSAQERIALRARVATEQGDS